MGSDPAIMKETKQKNRSIYLCNHTGELHTHKYPYILDRAASNKVLPTTNLRIPAVA
jgi:hypothetical protein